MLTHTDSDYRDLQQHCEYCFMNSGIRRIISEENEWSHSWAPVIALNLQTVDGFYWWYFITICDKAEFCFYLCVCNTVRYSTCQEACVWYTLCCVWLWFGTERFPSAPLNWKWGNLKKNNWPSTSHDIGVCGNTSHGIMKVCSYYIQDYKQKVARACGILCDTQ